MLTCHKGSQGKIGCRLCCPNDVKQSTSPVELLQRCCNASDVCDPNGNTPILKLPKEDRPRTWDSHQPVDHHNDGPHPKHHLKNILDNKLDKTVIVWETKRPVINIPHLTENPMDKPNPKEYICEVLHDLLHGVPAYGGSNDIFWDWIHEHATVDQLMDIFLHLRESLPTSNGYVAAFSPVLSLCTGAHNNASLLGSIGQAKAALFYLIPYQGKTKFPLMGSLTLIEQAISHIEKYKSTAKDSGSTTRTVTHLLQRTINRIHLQIEISDYQVAASLLEMPSTIMTDSFAYGNPLAIPALRAKMNIENCGPDALAAFADRIAEARENAPVNRTNTPLLGTTVQEIQGWTRDDLAMDCSQHDSDAESASPPRPNAAAPQCETPTNSPFHMNNPFCPPIVDTEAFLLTRIDGGIPVTSPSDILQGLGHIRKVRTQEATKHNKEDEVSTFLPSTSLFLYRHSELRCLSYYEYLAVVQFVNMKPRQTDIGQNTHKLRHFPLDPQFLAHSNSYHALGLKQHTPLLTGVTPRHPGNKPSSLATRSGIKWTAKANYYAKYYLALFRPEDITTAQGYNWTDLEDYISILQNDTSIISKFRLMTMHSHMAGMRTTEKVKKMTLQYRGRKRDLWTSSQRLAYETYRVHNAPQVYTDYSSPDAPHLLPELGQQTINIMYKRLRHDAMQIQAVTPLGSATAIRQTDLSNSIVYPMTTEELFEKYEAVLNWRPTSASKRQTPETPCSPPPPTKRQKVQQLNELRAKLLARGNVATQQVQLFDIYSDAFLAKKGAAAAPSIAIIHGPPGVGKSHVRKAITEAAKICGRYNDNTSFNSIHAIDMEGGTTTCTATGYNTRINSHRIGDFQPKVLAAAREKLRNYEPRQVVNHIDEFGTQAPPHLARKDALDKLLTADSCSNDFGGRTTLMYGDLILDQSRLRHLSHKLFLTSTPQNPFAGKFECLGKAKKLVLRRKWAPALLLQRSTVPHTLTTLAPGSLLRCGGLNLQLSNGLQTQSTVLFFKKCTKDSKLHRWTSKTPTNFSVNKI